MILTNTPIGKIRVVKRPSLGEVFNGKTYWLEPLKETQRYNGWYWETIKKELL